MRTGACAKTTGPILQDFAKLKARAQTPDFRPVPLDEAIEWVRRCPHPMPGEDTEIEIRPVYEREDFGPEFTPELRARQEELRVEIERQQGSH